MEENLKNIEKFFQADMQIKKDIYESFPQKSYSYNKESETAYSEVLYKKLENIKYNMDKILDTFSFFNQYRDKIEKQLETCKQELINCPIDYYKLKDFYNKNIGSMREEFIEKVGEECYGYGIGDCGKYLIEQAKTTNELLHVMHQSIINDQRILQSMPILNKKTNAKGYTITLYGINQPLSQNIFDSFEEDLEVGYTDILSLPNSKKVLLLVRDVGHALSIEIDCREEKDFVRYFIPKICNVEMVNKLKGVSPVNKDSQYTVGMFETTKDETSSTIIDFISKVPTDKDVPGPFYEEFQRMLEEKEKNTASEIETNVK